VTGFLSGSAVTPSNGVVLASMVAPYPAQVRTVVAVAVSSGGSATILDLRKNGVSMYHGGAPRPTVGAGVSGKFSVAPPSDRGVQDGDLLSLIVLTAGGHGNVVATAALEKP
jgi:hypothetical protein